MLGHNLLYRMYIVTDSIDLSSELCDCVITSLQQFATTWHFKVLYSTVFAFHCVILH